ncbi:NAD(P)/FAD-dependent oxidoreductase [Pseudomonas syringae group sp. J309-1]|uniref:NAD(P)/FAD-dependent oxidoreductase n=1 Tax=Pseudomonas syringae group sp. J309-1 TaxID=3079588 RepID=UPI000419B2F9|nr:NAD(P)/FAD-dependent oxidoreductase [Pseudomonas syringae group sp. J309-1]MCQ2997631.1 NAD(P)/FAD-dependent oxidoreductase [Pseudomonas syringae]MDG6401932.1 NAD(P)/FAD-dependent oxidoreductase [Pseudomonas quasicaspiana]MCQ3000959.1 NAD(P)/FAD-dependent oxidoreductase [Pseudomonas syringae]MCQ3033727.1 NAD(P)/FAD-dependent oxidoreductase [Pseudomonas syringae]MDU8360200.1 NAD(P)/FAD-dependent oxidoreductase [Pseudomonas syringae group sp. J309-1]
MLRITELKLPIDHPDEDLRPALLQRLGIASDELLEFTLFKRSYDARKKSSELCFIYTIDFEVRDEAALLLRHADDRHLNPAPDVSYKVVGHAPEGLTERPVVVGFGPCGIFAGLLLAQMGFKPIILERGKEVRQRTKDTWGLWRKNVLNPESNVQFGEGGAGTFSDGKLYSQIKDPKFHGRKVLHEFVKAGAPEEILYVSKPHIGTFRLTGVVENMRHQIEALGGEVRFEQRVTDVLIDNGQLQGVVLDGGERIDSRHVIMALGHSARDTFRMLHSRGVYMEAKPFSVGFRIEHPQSLIDRARLGKYAGHPKLGAADYKLVHHAKNGRSVYSFCMCPGGTVVAATSEPNRVVTNGMSQYSRNERNANSGIVVGITPEDYPGSPLAGIELQERLESHAYVLGGSTYEAPAQLVGDFIAGKTSQALGSVEPSYKPGVKLVDLADALPAYAIEAIREALPAFDKQIKGFALHDAVLTGIETRTSAPLRITRNESMQSLNVKGLFPAGEGAGYAGGILSAGVDGIRIAEALARSMLGIEA